MSCRFKLHRYCAPNSRAATRFQGINQIFDLSDRHLAVNLVAKFVKPRDCLRDEILILRTEGNIDRPNWSTARSPYVPSANKRCPLLSFHGTTNSSQEQAQHVGHGTWCHSQLGIQRVRRIGDTPRVGETDHAQRKDVACRYCNECIAQVSAHVTSCSSHRARPSFRSGRPAP